jgi:hypothetical protein
VNGSASYHLRVYDSSGRAQPLIELTVSSGGTCGTAPCWRPIGQTGFRYKNGAGAPDGITTLTLKSARAGKTSIQVRGRGADLPTPTLGLKLPATVEFVISDESGSECWLSAYASPISNDAAEFSAREP